MTSFNGPSFGALRMGVFRDGGSAVANACLTVLRDTLWSRANCRIDNPRTLASRRTLAKSSTLNSITAFHRWEKHFDGINRGVGSTQTAIHQPASLKLGPRWAQVKLRNRSPIKLP